ncbi:hypothetical protein BJQ89_02274 [Arthrobacter sp. ES1]|nr:hypothetical protein [Arthrobacter sp. ES1]
MHPDELEEPRRNQFRVVSRRLVHFEPCVLAAGEFEVPSGIVAAGPPAQGYAVRRQGQGRRVEILGLQLLLNGPFCPGHPRQLVKRRQRGPFVDVVLSLDFNAVLGGHDTV